MDNVVKNATAALPMSGNQSDSTSSTTHAVISPAAIKIGGQSATDAQLAGLSRDADTAANSLKPIFDLQKVQDSMAMGQVVGEIGVQVTGIVRTAMERDAYVANDQAMADAESKLTPAQQLEYSQQHPEAKAAYLEKIDKENALTANSSLVKTLEALPENMPESSRQALMEILARNGDLGALAQASQAYTDARNHTGAGSNFSVAAQALTSLASGIAGGNVNQALAGAIQPYLTQQVGQYFDEQTQLAQANGQSTTGIESARLLAHAAVGAAVAYGSGNDAGSGVIGAVSGEAMAQVVRQTVYDGRTNEELTPEERDNVRTIATLASGLVGAVSGGSFENAATAANAGYNSAMHNDGGCSENPNDPFSCELEAKLYKEYVACESHPDQPCVVNPVIDIASFGLASVLYACQNNRASEECKHEIKVAAATGLVGGALGKFARLLNEARIARAAGNVAKEKGLLQEASSVCTAGSGRCFTAGTMVQTDKGLQAIETFIGGELVWSREESGGASAFKPVTATKVTENEPIYEVVVTNSTGEIEVFNTTAEHPFFTKQVGWLKTSWLQAGMELVDAHNQPLTLESVRLTDRVETVYNIEVADYHTYHIGEFGVWVHNDCCYVSYAADGSVQYVGITNNFARRAAEHLRTKGIDIQQLDLPHLPISDRKAVEQALIVIHGLEKNGGTLLNKINSISPKRSDYASQLQRGYDLLKSIGYGF
jgi:filamentous hemagglutinin